MYYLIYVSTAVAPHSKDELLALAARAREFNRKIGITGLLLYKDGCFMQLLEGDRSAVEGLFGSIYQDLRHHSVTILQESEQPSRQFPDWSMAFFNLNESYVNYLPGYSEYKGLPLSHEAFQVSPIQARKLLNAFTRHAW